MEPVAQFNIYKYIIEGENIGNVCCGKAYDGLQQLSSVDFELCSGINDHFPQNAEYHVMMFLKCAAMFEELIGKKTRFQETIVNN